MGQIMTYSGIMVDPFDYSIYDYSAHDIAHVLSMKCRFGGHCENFYSVGRHSINVKNGAELLEANLETQLWALLHDAPEYVIGDVLSPVKKELPMFQELDNKISSKMQESIDRFLPGWTEKIDHKLILDVDVSMLIPEMRELMSNAIPVKLPNGVCYAFPADIISIKTVSFKQDKIDFLSEYDKLWSLLEKRYEAAREERKKQDDEDIPF